MNQDKGLLGGCMEVVKTELNDLKLTSIQNPMFLYLIIEVNG